MNTYHLPQPLRDLVTKFCNASFYCGQFAGGEFYDKKYEIYQRAEQDLVRYLLGDKALLEKPSSVLTEYRIALKNLRDVKDAELDSDEFEKAYREYLLRKRNLHQELLHEEDV